MHSYYSDDDEPGPGGLVRQCGMNSIRIIPITDHNNVRTNGVGRQTALRARVTYAFGMGIDCTFKGANFHVLGYGIDDTSHDSTCIENSIRSQAVAAPSQILYATGETGFEVTAEDTAGPAGERYWEGRRTEEMFAEVFLGRKKYEDRLLLLPYGVGGARGGSPFVNFYWDFYSQGKCCYVKMEYPQLEEMVDAIHRNGGYAVLAYPGVNLEDRVKLLGPILEAGMDGIEAFSSYHSQEQAVFCHKIAYGKFGMITCGSDYHGKTKSSISIGDHGCTVPYEEMTRQLGRILGDTERKERSRGTRMEVLEMNDRRI